MIEWLVFVDEIEGKQGLVLDVMLHSMQRLAHFVAEYVPNMFFSSLSLPPPPPGPSPFLTLAGVLSLSVCLSASVCLSVYIYI